MSWLAYLYAQTTYCCFWNKQRSTQILKLDLEEIDLFQQYKYLDLSLDEYLNFEPCDDLYAKLGGISHLFEASIAVEILNGSKARGYNESKM